MTTPDTALAVQALLDAGMSLVDPTPIEDPDEVLAYLAVLPEGAEARLVDVASQLDAYRDTPRRKKGKVLVENALSFARYWKKHADPDGDASEVYADIQNSSITAILDAHGPATAGWGEHRCTLTLRTSPSWTRWVKNNGALLPQSAFAEHIEASIADILVPDGATLLEVCQTIQATVGADFESGVRLDSGQRRFTYRETVAARAGQTGQLEIPATFRILVTPWVMGPSVETDARLRYRITGEGLKLGYVIDDTDTLKETVFEALVGEVGDLLSAVRGDEVFIHRGRYC